MKKLSVTVSVLCISILIAVPAFAQLAYQLDVGQDGTFETGGSLDLGVSESVDIDIYLSGYTCSPGPPVNGLFGTMKYILVDGSKVSVSGFPYDTDNLGPWDPSFCDFLQREPNVYYLTTAKFTYVTVVDGIQKLGTMTLTGTAGGTFTISVANDLTSLGYGTYNNGYIADCNLNSQFPADAVLTVQVTAPTTTTTTSVAPTTTTTSVEPTTTTTSVAPTTTTTSVAPTTTTTTIVSELSYEIDVNQDGTFETGGSIDLNLGESVTMDIYVSGYDCVETGCPACGPNDGLFRTLQYILADESQVSVSGLPFDTDNGGPWDQTICGFLNPEPNVYSLGAANFFYVTVTGGQQKLGTITLAGIAQDAFNLVVANDLTAFKYPAYSDGYISNCNLGQEYPANALLTINPECDIDADCADALFCNGTETCENGVCQNGAPVSCPDDGTFCNGTEGCSEQADACVSSDNPCGAGTVCNEATNTCEELVTASISRLVPPYEFKSRWFPLLRQLRIIGSDTNFKAGISKVAFEPVKAVWGFRPQVADEENIRIWVYILPKWFSGPLDGPVEVIVTTGSEVVSTDWEIELLPFPLDKEGEELQ